MSCLGSWRSDVIKMPPHNLIDILIAAHIGAAQNWSSASLEDSDSGSSWPKIKLTGKLFWKGERIDLLQRDKALKALRAVTSFTLCDHPSWLWREPMAIRSWGGKRLISRQWTHTAHHHYSSTWSQIPISTFTTRLLLALKIWFTRLSFPALESSLEVS